MITTSHFLIIVIALITIECALAIFILWLRQSCPWLIIGRDEHPKLDKRGLSSFIKHGWDSELGWIRKPNTSGIEKGRHNVDISYQIDASGARLNPGFENQKPEILAYGDSYAFARQVNDNETWPHYMSQSLGINVANYGVGNYGFDQALLRLEREFDNRPASIVVMCVVPETMSRIHAYWKHYSEYGNTFAFKPRFELVNNDLTIRPNLIDHVSKFEALDDFLLELAAADYFYKAKFKRDILTFPISLSLFRNPERTFPLIWSAFTDRLGLTRDKAFIRVMRRNIDINRALYRKPESVALFKSLVLRFAEFCKQRNAAPVLLMIPQRMDIEHIVQGDHYYKDFLQALPKHITVADAADTLMNEPEVDPLFINDKYGGHLSVFGNQLIAKLLKPVCEKLLKQNTNDTTINSNVLGSETGQHKDPLT